MYIGVGTHSLSSWWSWRSSTSCVVPRRCLLARLPLSPSSRLEGCWCEPIFGLCASERSNGIEGQGGGPLIPVARLGSPPAGRGHQRADLGIAARASSPYRWRIREGFGPLVSRPGADLAKPQYRRSGTLPPRQVRDQIPGEKMNHRAFHLSSMTWPGPTWTVVDDSIALGRYRYRT